MTTIDLSGPRLKIARAKHHIRDFESLIEAFISNSPHRIEIKKDQNGVHILSVFDRPIPVESAAIIGDAIHNIRAALDHLVACAVRAAGNTPNRNNGFPFYKDKSGFEGGISSKLSGCSQGFITYVKDLEPYIGGKGDRSYAIAEMDNLDKHITLVPIITVATIKNVVVTGPGMSFTCPRIDLSSDGQNSSLSIGNGPGFEIKADPETFSIRFPRTDMRDQPAVVPFLKDMCSISLGIIEAVKT